AARAAGDRPARRAVAAARGPGKWFVHRPVEPGAAARYVRVVLGALAAGAAAQWAVAAAVAGAAGHARWWLAGATGSGTAAVRRRVPADPVRRPRRVRRGAGEEAEVEETVAGRRNRGPRARRRRRGRVAARRVPRGRPRPAVPSGRCGQGAEREL